MNLRIGTLAAALTVFGMGCSPLVIPLDDTGGDITGTTCSEDSDCDDQLTCTIDSCTADGTCLHAVTVNRCFIGGKCYSDGDSSPTDSCTACVPATAPGSWTNICDPDVTADSADGEDAAEVIADTTPEVADTTTPDPGPDTAAETVDTGQDVIEDMGQDTIEDMGQDVAVDIGQDVAVDIGQDVPTCPATHTCTAPAPAGWSGPVARYEGDSNATSPACVGDYGSKEFTLNGDFDPGKATCGCTCGDAAGTTCPAVETRLQVCGGIYVPSTKHKLSDGVCTSLGGLYSKSEWSVSGSGVSSGGACTANPTEIIATPSFGVTSLGCGGATALDGCSGDDECLPTPNAPFDSQLCIFQAGEANCPTGSIYSERVLRYDDYEDSRVCSSCSCGAPTGTCSGKAVFVKNAGCGMSSFYIGEVAAGKCSDIGGSADYAIYSATSDAACAPTTVSVEGAAKTTGSVTVCCAP